MAAGALPQTPLKINTPKTKNVATPEINRIKWYNFKSCRNPHSTPQQKSTLDRVGLKFFSNGKTDP